ncbi:MAG: hypothetical protein IJ489_02015 [Clostridia bacterium]|nr:hypothetical protein [Clostridia bacterium]
MSFEIPFTKDNLDFYLKELAKEYKKQARGMDAELILIGGASVLINYGFREMTYDIDAVIAAPSVMKDAINTVGDRHNLPNGWLNADFKNTISYSPKLARYSEYYRTYANVLQIRTVRAEYLVAMKLVSGRKYKKDLSDIVGVLYEQQRAGNPLTYELIDKAMNDLYDGWDHVSDYAKDLLNIALKSEHLDKLFVELSEDEATAKAALLEMDKKYPNVVNKDNVNDIIAIAMAKKKKREEREER